jgi:hypothetical protein
MNWEIPAKSKDTGDVVRAGTCRLDSLILKTGPRPRHPRSIHLNCGVTVTVHFMCRPS